MDAEKTELQCVLDAAQQAKTNARLAKRDGDWREHARQKNLQKLLEKEAVLLGYVPEKKAPRVHRRVSMRG